MSYEFGPKRVSTPNNPECDECGPLPQGSTIVRATVTNTDNQTGAITESEYALCVPCSVES